MANYLVSHYKGVYRILPDLTYDSTDFARNMDGSIDEDAVYIKCKNNCKVYAYGNGVLTAYIPTLIRGHNMLKAMKKDGIEIVDSDESSEEVIIRFKAKDIEYMADLMGFSSYGASTSPYSPKNIPKNKEAKIPDEDMQRYKDVVSKVDKKDVLRIRNWNTNFLEKVLQKKIRKVTKDKKYSYKEDMKSLNMSRQAKEFIYVKEMWNDYLDYLDSAIQEYYN